MKNISFIILSLSLFFVPAFVHSMEETTSDDYLNDALLLIQTNFYDKNNNESYSFAYDEDKFEIYSKVLKEEPQKVHEENNSIATKPITQELEPYDPAPPTIFGPDNIKEYEEYCTVLKEYMYLEKYCKALEKQLYETLKKNKPVFLKQITERFEQSIYYPAVQTYSHPEDEENDEFIRKCIEGINDYTNGNLPDAPNSFCADDRYDLKVSSIKKQEINSLFNKVQF